MESKGGKLCTKGLKVIVVAAKRPSLTELAVEDHRRSPHAGQGRNRMDEHNKHAHRAEG